MTVDLHSHTWYSGCGRDNPEELILRMIEKGVNVFGINDHNHGIAERKKEYFELLTSLREKYKDKIKLFRGIELATINNLHYKNEDISYFDYCLIEHLDLPGSVINDDIVSYAKSTKIKGTGIAHTDLFKYCKDRNLDEYVFFKSLKDGHVFWEMNVTYDSIHNYYEHPYVKEFKKSKYQQDLIKQVGLFVSVGFDKSEPHTRLFIYE